MPVLYKVLPDQGNLFELLIKLDIIKLPYPKEDAIKLLTQMNVSRFLSGSKQMISVWL